MYEESTAVQNYIKTNILMLGKYFQVAVGEEKCEEFNIFQL